MTTACSFNLPPRSGGWDEKVWGDIQAWPAMNCVPRIHKDKSGTLPIVLYQNEKWIDVNTSEIDTDDIDDNDDAEEKEVAVEREEEEEADY